MGDLPFAKVTILIENEDGFKQKVVIPRAQGVIFTAVPTDEEPVQLDEFTLIRAVNSYDVNLSLKAHFDVSAGHILQQQYGSYVDGREVGETWVG